MRMPTVLSELNGSAVSKAGVLYLQARREGLSPSTTEQRRAIARALPRPEWAHVQFAEAVRVPNRFAVSIKMVSRPDFA